uniref:Alpha/beta hydrolase n=1 Tax=Thermosporothrix sp. COM3 TaxID=2490863 RepID=A0A455SD50_9CHLR|nr:alpha/beta hydrolase [Thermosporothrix sp. COM3]
MFIILALLVLFLLLLLELCWYFAHQVLRRKSDTKERFVRILELEEGKEITLQNTRETRRPGIFGLEGSEGQAIVGPVFASDAQSVTRQLIHVEGKISPRTAGIWNTTIYGGKMQAQLNLPIEEVAVPTPLGDMPAWFVPGGSCWAILVHGATANREQGLRVLPTLAECGLSTLTITFRNDAEAPASPDGLSHLGASEWEDLEAGVRYALDHGAEQLILYGWSMGGTIVELFLRQSALASQVRAVVLDSPILNWRASLESIAKKNGLPAFFVRLVEPIILLRTGVRLSTLDLTTRSQGNSAILLFHGTEDTIAPIALSDRFASTHADIITYHRVPNAEHTQCWNANGEKYEAILHAFLHNILKKDAH